MSGIRKAMSGVEKTLIALAMMARLPTGNSTYNLPRPRAAQVDRLPAGTTPARLRANVPPARHATAERLSDERH